MYYHYKMIIRHYYRSNNLEEIVAWLKAELRGIESRTCGAEVIEPEVVQQIEQEIQEYLQTQDTNTKTVFMQVKPPLLFKPGLHSRNIVPDPNTQTRLLDRIRCVRIGFTVPLGVKGTIIGIQRASNPMDTMYDVLFDQSFMGNHRVYNFPSNISNMFAMLIRLYWNRIFYMHVKPDSHGNVH